MSTLFSQTFRMRTKELFFGYQEAFENPEEKTMDAARKAGKVAALALRRHMKKSSDGGEKEDENEKKPVEEFEEKSEEPEEPEHVERGHSDAAKEAFETKDTPKPMNKGGKVALIIFLVISSIVGFYAAYLSWKANTVFELTTPVKVVFSFFAFLGGISYLLSYVIYRWKETEYVIKIKTGGPMETASAKDGQTAKVLGAVGAVGAVGAMAADDAGDGVGAADADVADNGEGEESNLTGDYVSASDFMSGDASAMDAAAIKASSDMEQVESPTEPFTATESSVGGRGKARRGKATKVKAAKVKATKGKARKQK